MIAAEKLTGDAAIPFLSAVEMLDLLESRRISAVELLNLHLKRIAQINPALNAVVALDEARALAAAEAADALRMRGEGAAPLLGLPTTIKDVYETEGLRTTSGISALAGYVPERDADAVARLRAAGAVIFGKTNVPEGASDHQTYNAVYGLTRNPFDLDRTPGGSSGGAAAALAAGFTPVELGSDIGGSIRIPAHFCGVYGHKASFGAIPLRGHIPPKPGVLSPADLAVAGPMARSAADLELLLDLLVAPASWDQSAWSIRIPPSRHERLSAFRVAVWTGGPYAADSATRAVLSQLSEGLRRLGVKVDEAARPAFDPAESFDIYLRTLFGIVAGAMPSDTADAIAAAAIPADASYYAGVLAHSGRMSLAEWERLREDRYRLRRAWRDFFLEWDAVICPAASTPAFRHDVEREGLAGQLQRRRMIDGADAPYMSQLMWPGLATVANLPATVAPLGRSPEGLPIGAQIIGPYLEDRTTLRLAGLIGQ